MYIVETHTDRVAADLTSLAICIRNLHPRGVSFLSNSLSRSPPWAYSVMMYTAWSCPRDFAITLYALRDIATPNRTAKTGCLLMAFVKGKAQDASRGRNIKTAFNKPRFVKSQERVRSFSSDSWPTSGKARRTDEANIWMLKPPPSLTQCTRACSGA